MRFGRRFMVALVSVGLLAGCGRVTNDAPRSDPQQIEIPPEAREAALEALEGQHGPVHEVANEVAILVADWRQLEPDNTAGIGAVLKDEDMVYALLVRGSFEVVGPPRPPPHTAQVTVYDLGRVVFDASGELVNTQLWSSANPGGRDIEGAAFGPTFDD